MSGWTLVDDIAASENADWTQEEPLNAGEENLAWTSKTSVLQPNVISHASGLMGFGGFAVEELSEFPEDIDIAPEEIQSDFEAWTLVTSEAD